MFDIFYDVDFSHFPCELFGFFTFIEEEGKLER